MSTRTEQFSTHSWAIDPPVVGTVPVSARMRAVRRVTVGVLVADVVALLTAGVLLVTRPDPTPSGRRVVDAQCIDHHIVQGLDIGAPDGGLLAWDTGVTCR